MNAVKHSAMRVPQRQALYMVLTSALLSSTHARRNSTWHSTLQLPESIVHPASGAIWFVGFEWRQTSMSQLQVRATSACISLNPAGDNRWQLRSTPI
jgi:hypothetical protein